MGANALAVSGASTLVFMFCFSFRPLAPSLMTWIQHMCAIVDVPSDAILAMLAARVLRLSKHFWNLGDNVNDGDEGVGACKSYRHVGTLVEQHRARLIREKLMASTTAMSGPALAVAALLEETPADELMTLAMERFRSIQWPILAENSHIITGGGLLQDVGAGNAQLYELSAPCKLSSCDVFWSHSWSDNAATKWQAV